MDDDKTEPVKEFFGDPSIKPGERKRFATRLEYLKMHGLALLSIRDDLFCRIFGEDNLYELRLENSDNNPRVLLCTHGKQTFVLLHAFKKLYDGTIERSEIDLAAKRRDKIKSAGVSK